MSDLAGSVAVRAPRPAGWVLSVYPQAGEAGGCFVSSYQPERSYVARGNARDPQRAADEAARRARAKVRRFCAANGLNRMGSLTYAPLDPSAQVILRGHIVRCSDPRLVRAHVGEFFRSLRDSLGGKPLPYVWVPELHGDGVNFHIHFAVRRFIHWRLVCSTWGLGGVNMKLLGDLPVGSGTLGEARRAAGYLSKYVTKQFTDPSTRPFGMHRYDVAQGFQPQRERIWGRCAEEVLARASQTFGQDPSRQWSSADVEGWQGPPAIWAQWGR